MTVRRSTDAFNNAAATARTNASSDAPAADSNAPAANASDPPPPAADEEPRSVDVNARNAARAAARANEARVQGQLKPEDDAITGNQDLDNLLKQLPPSMLNQIRNIAKALRQMQPKPAAQKPATSTGMTNGARNDVRVPEATAGPNASTANSEANGAANGSNRAAGGMDLDELAQKVEDEQNKNNANAARANATANANSANGASTTATGANGADNTATNTNLANSDSNNTATANANAATANANAAPANANAATANANAATASASAATTNAATANANAATANANAATAHANAATANANAADAKKAVTQQQYNVKKGDTLSHIARQHGLSMKQLLDANPAKRANPDKLRIGEKIAIPQKATAQSNGTGTPVSSVTGQSARPTDPPISGTPTPPAPPTPTPTRPTDPPISGTPTPTPTPTRPTDPPVSGTPTPTPTPTEPTPTPTEPTPPPVSQPTPPVSQPTPPVSQPTPPVSQPTPPVSQPTPPPVSTPIPPPVSQPTPPPVSTEPPSTTRPPIAQPPVVQPPVAQPPSVRPPVTRPTTPPVVVQPPSTGSTGTAQPQAVPQGDQARRYETQGVIGAGELETARQGLGDRTFAQLKSAGLLPADAKLDSALPADVQKRVDADPALKAANPKSYGDLMKALVGDNDKNGKLDFDALELNKVVPNASQQQILNALTKNMSKADLQAALKASGASSIRANNALDDRLKVNPPTGFGLDGANAIDEVQQQTLLRTGIVFADSNKNGKLDADDKVSFLDKDGTVKDTTFGQLPADLQKTVKLNVATADAARSYAALDGKNQVKFPHYHRATGESDPEAVNKEFWSIGSANVYGRNQTSWSLNAGKSPADAIDDVVGGKNSAQYTTECAQMRDVMRLKGLRDYYTNEYGKDEGTFRFNAQFPKDAGEAQKANAYLQKLDEFKKANPGKGWSEFQAQQKAPDVQYAMQISRHDVLSGTGAVIAPWQTSTTAGDSAAGDAGYFQNHSVSVDGVRIGYVGENVLDVGFAKNPKTGRDERQFWGHPGGIQSESSWQQELASNDMKVKNGADIAQYFSKTDVQRGLTKQIDAQAKRIDDLLAPGRMQTPEQRARLEQDKGFLEASKSTLGAVTNNVDPKKLDALKGVLQDGKATSIDAMNPVFDALTADGKKQAAAGFDALHPTTQDALAKLLGKDKAALTSDEKAKAALFATLSDGQQLSRTAQNTIAQSIVNTNADAFLHAAPVDPKTKKATGPAGPLFSRDTFATWLKSDEFAKWYEDKTGSAWSGSKNLDDLSQSDVQKLVELALPQTASLRTVYGQVNGGTPQTVSSQLAALLKNGALPDAEYRSEGTSIPRS